MLFAAILLQASVAAPVFDPPIGIPLRIVSERIETGASERRFAMERLLRFRRDDAGYVAEVLVLRAEGSGSEAIGTMVEAGFAALAGKPILFRLDRAGRVTAIDDMAAVWARLCDGIGGVAAERRSPASREGQAIARRVTLPLRAMPPERQREMLASLVTAAIALDAVEPAGTTRVVALPGYSPYGGPMTLHGVRSATARGDGLVETVTHAAANVSLPAEGDAPARHGGVEFETLRRADPATGLLALSIDTTRTRLGTGADARHQRKVVSVRIAVAAEEWPSATEQ